MAGSESLASLGLSPSCRGRKVRADRSSSSKLAGSRKRTEKKKEGGGVSLSGQKQGSLLEERGTHLGLSPLALPVELGLDRHLPLLLPVREREKVDKQRQKTKMLALRSARALETGRERTWNSRGRTHRPFVPSWILVNRSSFALSLSSAFRSGRKGKERVSVRVSESYGESARREWPGRKTVEASRVS